MANKLRHEGAGRIKDPPYVLERHLERFWNALGDEFHDSWDDSTIETEIPRIWQKKTIEQAVSSIGDKPSN
jgi:hypothetical protein